jgi:hypothetical protein
MAGQGPSVTGTLRVPSVETEVARIREQLRRTECACYFEPRYSSVTQPSEALFTFLMYL